MKSSFFNYLFATAIITILILLVYATVQQSYRTAANDPQIQLSEDIAARLSAGKPVDTYFSDTIDISKSMSTFITLFDGSGNPVRSTGYLDGQMCKLPSGLFDHARKNQMHSVTWQPRSDVRMAVVLTHVAGSPVEFVAAGRSLREVEERELSLRKMILIAWGLCILLVLISSIIYFKNQNQNLQN